MTLILAFATWFAMPAASASAQDEPAEGATRIVVSPLVYLRGESSGAVARDSRAVREGLESYVRHTDDDFELVDVTAVNETITEDSNYAQLVQVGAEWAEIGMTKYRELDASGAAESLARAYSQYRQAGHEFVAPTEVAEVLLFLALAALERGGDVVGPLDVMKEMVQLDPAREVNRGAYPDEVVQFYDSARLALEREVRERGPDQQLVKRLARRADADHVLAASVLPNPDQSVELVVWRYDAADDAFGASETVRVEEPTQAKLRDAANRLSSRIVSCLVAAEERSVDPVAPSSGQGPFALQLGFAYASYLQFMQVGGRNVEPFDHLGASLGASFHLTREFALVAMFQFLTSTDEYSGLVQPGFTTLRMFAGGELGIDVGKFRIALGTLVEGAAVSEIVLCPGREKAVEGACAEETTAEPVFLVGVNARPRLTFAALRSLDVFVSGSTSFFFVPLTDNDLNFLTALEAGVEYRF